MTLIVTINGPKTIWLLADRRVCFPHKRPKDDARKVLLLRARDGFGILGYAGLGETIKGTEPSDWMSGVLRGRDLPFETDLAVLADAIKRQMPPHMGKISGHTVVATARVGEEARLYSIDLLFTRDRKGFWFRYVRLRKNLPGVVPLRNADLMYGGSGAGQLLQDTTWMRPLRRLVQACDRDKVSAHAVADYLARLNLRVHRAQRAREAVPSVGSNCIVAWARRPDSTPFRYQFYSGTDRQKGDFTVPFLDRGNEINRLLGELLRNPDAPDLGQLPTEPDENLL